MKTDDAPSRNAKSVLVSLLAYVLWLVSIAACLAAVVQLRSTVNVLWVALGGSRWTLGLANQVALLLGGFAAFCYVMFLEGYYRKATKRLQDLRRRFLITVAIPAGIFVLCLALVELALRGMR